MARGDHVYVRCQANGIPFQHHGIDMGDGTVIHLAPESGARIALRDNSEAFSVRRDPMSVFSNGEPVHVVELTGERTKAETAAAAEAQLGRTGYSLLDDNCEHFARFCATGKSESHQIEMSAATVSTVASMATKAVWSISSKVGGKLALRSATKVHPAAMLADGVEMATLAIGCKQGLEAGKAKKVAKVTGTVAAAGIGGIIAGPAGAVACVAAHSASGVVADSICDGIRRVLS